MQAIAKLEDIPQYILDNILEHAEQVAPNECCGVIVQMGAHLSYFDCRNISNNGKDTFRIHPLDYADAEEAGTIVAIVHSHPYASPAPSAVDLLACSQGTLPWLIVNYPVGTAALALPEPFVLPLKGRQFVHGAVDCYTLVRDYYAQVLNIALPDFPRDDDWWNNGQNLYLEQFEQAGFVRVDDAPRKHDGFLMQIRADIPNHAAIYLGDEEGKIIHHLPNRLSGTDIYGNFWQRLTVAHLRHKDLLHAHD